MNNPAGADASLMLLLFVFVGAAVVGVVVAFKNPTLFGSQFCVAGTGFSAMIVH